jgi:hypothetical protein
LSQGECGAVRTEHPTRKRTEGLIREFAEEVFSAPVLHALHNTKRLSKEGMPTIVNGLKNIRIM